MAKQTKGFVLKKLIIKLQTVEAIKICEDTVHGFYKNKKICNTTLH